MTDSANISMDLSRPEVVSLGRLISDQLGDDVDAQDLADLVLVTTMIVLTIGVSPDDYRRMMVAAALVVVGQKTDAASVPE